MAKGIYLEKNGLARKVKKIYIGDNDGIARMVKKAYVGVQEETKSFARLFFNSLTKVLKSLGVVGVSSLSTNYYGQSIASTSGHVIIAGGTTGSVLQTNCAEAWNKNLVRFTTTALTGRFYHKSGSAGNYAIFVGGFNTGSGWSASSCCTTVEAYDDSLVKHNCSQLSHESFNTPVAYNDKHFMSFGGGYYSGVTKTVDSYDNNLLKTVCASLDSAKKLSACTKAGEYLICAGGSTSTSATGGTARNVEAYNNDLVKSACTDIDLAVVNATGAWVNGYAMIIGGNQNSENGEPIKNINIYDKDLVKLTSLSFPVATSLNMATTIKNGKYAVIGAGRTGINSSWQYPKTYYIYDDDLVLVKTLKNAEIRGNTGNSTMATELNDIAFVMEYNTTSLLKAIGFDYE